MPRLLLVHDDKRTIDRTLRHFAQIAPTWELRAARAVPHAWRIVEEWAPDAVAVMAHTPTLDGVELLLRVQRAHGQTVRIALGVDADGESTLRSLRIAHRALPEPLDPDALHEVIRVMLLLSDLVDRPTVRALLGRIGSLPAVPSVYTRLSRRLEDSNASVYELSQLVAEDATLAVQVLRIANSAFFRSQQRVNTIEAAAARLGTRLLRSVVLTAEVYGRFPVSSFMAERLEALQQHASLVARLAPALEPNAAWKDDAFAAGLLHDIGKLVLAAHVGEVHASIVREAERTQRPEFEVEQERLGIHHGALGACLLGMWGLPSAVLDSALRHHDPLGVLPDPLDAVSAVALANQLAHAAATPEGAAFESPPWAAEVLADPRWPAWRETAVECGQTSQAA